MEIRDKIFGAPVSNDVKKVFNKLQQSDLDPRPNVSVQPYQDYLGERTPFVRMWTALHISGSGEDKIKYFVINDNKQESYSPNDQIKGNGKFTPQLKSNDFLKPAAGITSITVKTSGTVGLIKHTTVNFMVHNKEDFQNIYLPFFLRPGATVCLDYGWSDPKGEQLYSIDSLIKGEDRDMSSFFRDVFGYGSDNENDGWLKKPKNFGIVQTVFGQVLDYTSTVTEEGSFNCTLTFSSGNRALLDSEISDDNDLKHILGANLEFILISGLTNRDASESVKNLQILDLLSSEQKKTVSQKWFDDYFIDKGFGIGVIDKQSLKLGIFHQDITSVGSATREMLYISFGLFEDTFLNNMIIKVKEDSKFNKYENSFSNEGNYVRWNENLYNRQTADLLSNEDLPSFLYPPLLEDFDLEDSDTELELLAMDQNDIVNHRLPIRDLFIEVSLIMEAFRTKQNANDALEHIFETINDESEGIFNIKMVPNNRAHSSVGFQDINLLPLGSFTRQEVETKAKDIFLTFDITSEKSIVSNCDLKFTTPKDKLASMIAIKSLGGENQIFDINSLDKFNLLFLLDKEIDKEKDVKIIQLPKMPNSDFKRKNNVTFDYDQIYTSIQNASPDVWRTTIKDKETQWQEFVTQINSELKGLEDGKFPLKVSSAGDSSTTAKPTEPPIIIKAISARDRHLKLAKLDTLLGSIESSISPVLPMELILTVYGNSYLDIGDFINVNYLPRQYKERCYFQILNFEDTIDESGWKTTYSTIIRIIPEMKKIVADNPTIGGNKKYKIEYDSEYVNFLTGKGSGDNKKGEYGIEENKQESHGDLKLFSETILRKTPGKRQDAKMIIEPAYYIQSRKDDRKILIPEKITDKPDWGDPNHSLSKNGNANISSNTVNFIDSIPDIAFIYAYSDVLYESVNHEEVQVEFYHKKHPGSRIAGPVDNVERVTDNPYKYFGNKRVRLTVASSLRFVGPQEESRTGRLTEQQKQPTLELFWGFNNLKASEFAKNHWGAGSKKLNKAVLDTVPLTSINKLAPIVVQTLFTRHDKNDNGEMFYICSFRETGPFSSVNIFKGTQKAINVSKTMLGKLTLNQFLKEIEKKFKENLVILNNMS